MFSWGAVVLLWRSNSTASLVDILWSCVQRWSRLVVPASAGGGVCDGVGSWFRGSLVFSWGAVVLLWRSNSTASLVDILWSCVQRWSRLVVPASAIGEVCERVSRDMDQCEA